MQDRLRKAGMRPISNIVDITNYVMLELGQPLHAFDYDLLQERAKSQRARDPQDHCAHGDHPAKQMITIDHVKRTLDDSMLLITDTAGPIAIAGVMGGAETEVYEGTRNVLLESATFEGINNRRTSQKLKLHSEASHRFTRGVPATIQRDCRPPRRRSHAPVRRWTHCARHGGRLSRAAAGGDGLHHRERSASPTGHGNWPIADREVVATA
jgi:phenylalanyl-tRNA synthetase beta subunit